MRRLSRAGFKKDFVRPALLPDWWEEACGAEQELLPDVEMRVARFLSLPLSVVRDPAAPLTPPDFPGAQLRRVRDVDRDRLAPAILSALQIAAAVVRCLRAPEPPADLPPADGRTWRTELLAEPAVVKLDRLVGDLWRRGIPVVPVDLLPAPSFQGLACVVDQRPVILLGHKHDEPGRVAFWLAHEVGHIVSGDCSPERLVLDQEDEPAAPTDLIEQRADAYAGRLLVADDEVPAVEATTFRELATRAVELERQTSTDASSIISAWAARTGDHVLATMAIKAIYRSTGARRLLRKHFDRFVDLDRASESDRSLLRCVHGDPVRDDAAH